MSLAVLSRLPEPDPLQVDGWAVAAPGPELGGRATGHRMQQPYLRGREGFAASRM